MSNDAEIRYETASILKLRTFAGGKVVDIDMLDDGGRPIALSVKKGTRGLKADGTVRVRIETRDWYEITRMRISLLDGTTSTENERGYYNHGARNHYFLEGPA